MLQNKKLLQLIVSAVLALLFVNVYLKAKEQTIQNGYGLEDVLVAARDIPPHSLLEPTYVTTRKIPLRYVEPGAIMVKLPGQELSQVQGKVTITAVPTGGQIIQSNLTDPTAKTTGVAPILPPGKVGYLLRLGNLDVAQLIFPGDHINVMATFTVQQKGASSKATYTILQNILVVGVGTDIKPSNQGRATKKESEGLVLTLALDPAEAERLALAQIESQGEITVVVRAPGDDSIKPLPGATPDHLLG